MDSKLLAAPDHLLKALLYDIIQQRDVKADDFRVVLNYKTVHGRRLVMRSDTFGIIIPLTLENLSDTSCRISIDAGGIVEQNAIRYRLMKLSVLPELLRTEVGTPGEYLLPVWSGTLVDFRDRPPSVNTDRVYLDQSEWEKFSMMNCFGCLAPGKNILGIIDSGDFFSQVDSEYNQGGVNRLYATFLIRKKYSDMVDPEAKSLLFFEADEGAQYGDLALIYRQYLLEYRGASFLRDRAENNPELAYSIDALRVKIFMAQKASYVPDGSSDVVVYTSCEEACEIIDAMKDAGIDKATITLVGWNLGGHDGAYPTRFPVEPAIGGEEGLRMLIAHAKAAGYKIVPHDNVTDIYRNSPDFDYEFVARDNAGEPVAAGIWGGGQSYKACPQVLLRRYGYEFERIRDLGFEGHYYLDAQSTVMWTCHAPAHPANEKEFALALAAITQIPRTLYGAVGIECVSVYAIPFIDEVARIACPEEDDPIYRNTPESFRKLDVYPVPFYSIALHGLLLHQNKWIHNYEDVGREVLRERVLGARPCMEVSYHEGANGGDFRESLELIAEPYRVCYKELNVQAVPVKAFRESVRGIYHIEYENGTVIAVNTTENSQEDLPARSWKKRA